MDLYSKFKSQSPHAFFLDPADKQALSGFLLHQKWINGEEEIRDIHTPGEGNMNCVLRIVTNKRSFILKQARPWVEKYPDVPAPLDRIQTEMAFYKVTNQNAILSAFLPDLLYDSPDNYIFCMEDLGEGADYTRVYQKSTKMPSSDNKSLMSFISTLHSITMTDKKFPTNQALKKLNHEHIFVYPYMDDNGLDLDKVVDGLASGVKKYKRDKALSGVISELGERYLVAGNTLIHGDYYPGSWLKTNEGIRVIDPEFAFTGYAEYDVGIMLAHYKMAGIDDEKINQFYCEYKQPEGFDSKLLTAFCGAEIVRRIMGLAQLPLDMILEERLELVDWAYRLLLSPGQWEVVA